MADSLHASEIDFVNLTDHEVRLGDRLAIPPAGRPARVLSGRHQDGSVVVEESEEVIPIYRFEPQGQIVGLPDPKPGVFYIVSPIVRRELTQRGVLRPDVLSPYAIESRLEQGKSMPCATALAR
jgi:hypothetical protein